MDREELLKQRKAIQDDGAEAIGVSELDIYPDATYYLDDKIAVMVPRCRVCGKLFYIAVLVDDLLKYHKGTLIQDAFPYLSADERELLISRTCPVCWNGIFSDEDEDLGQETEE